MRYQSEHILGLVNAEVCPTEFALGNCLMPAIKNGELIYRQWHKEVEELIEDNILELIRNYDKNRHVYVLKGWTTDEWSTNPDAQGEKAEQLKAMPRLLGLIEKDS